jgi:hypothetical protein
MDEEKFARRLATDVAALRDDSKKDLPQLYDTERALRNELLQRRHEGGWFMKMMQLFKSRPRFTTALFGCGLATLVLLWPISYERTVGHTVTVHLRGAAMSPQSLGPLARSMKKTLHAESVQVRAAAGAAGEELTFVAKLPSRSEKEADKLTQELLGNLRAQSLEVSAEVTARKQRTHGRVYAMALDKIIHIRVDTTGKTDTQVADEIRNQLESNGVHSPSVSFERHGDESQMEIKADVDGRQVQVKRMTKDASHPTVEVEIGGIDDKRDPGMTDAELREKILRQLEARGLDATVTVTGDRIEIRAHKRGAPSRAPSIGKAE